MDNLAEEFETRWNRDPIRPSIRDFLGRVEPKQREALFVELWAVERQLCDAKGEAIDLEKYEQEYSEFRSHIRSAGPHTDRTLAFDNRSETVTQQSPIDQKAQTIGPYRLLQRLGEGGMGSVWLADQKAPVRRQVALKIIKAGMDTEQVIARFEAERQALALMDHPGIAKVLDAGTTEQGRPFFVMELVRGQRITEFCDKHRSTTRQRLDLFVQVCAAVQHAHQRGIIHRDLKPSNVMVSGDAVKPLVKVIDFGLAKAVGTQLTDKTLFTQVGQIVGTPAYMSPEQADMSSLDIDTRTDVYSLGVILYELLTGTTPLTTESMRRAGLAEIRRLITENEPPAMSSRLSSLGDSTEDVARRQSSEPKTLIKLLRGDLDVIASKSLEKERSRRYASPSEFADDICRYLNHEAIEARPPTFIYRFGKLYQRHKLAVASSIAIATILLLSSVVSTVFAVWATTAGRNAQQRFEQLQIEQSKTSSALNKAEKAEREERIQREKAENAAKIQEHLRWEAQVSAARQTKMRQRAEASKLRAEWSAYVGDMSRLNQAWNQRDFITLGKLLQETTPVGNEADFRDWEWYFLKDQYDSSAVQPFLTTKSPCRIRLHGAGKPARSCFAMVWTPCFARDCWTSRRKDWRLDSHTKLCDGRPAVIGSHLAAP